MTVKRSYTLFEGLADTGLDFRGYPFGFPNAKEGEFPRPLALSPADQPQSGKFTTLSAKQAKTDKPDTEDGECRRLGRALRHLETGQEELLIAIVQGGHAPV